MKKRNIFSGVLGLIASSGSLVLSFFAIILIIFGVALPGGLSNSEHLTNLADIGTIFVLIMIVGTIVGFIGSILCFIVPKTGMIMQFVATGLTLILPIFMTVALTSIGIILFFLPTVAYLVCAIVGLVNINKYKTTVDIAKNMQNLYSNTSTTQAPEITKAPTVQEQGPSLKPQQTTDDED